MSNKQDTWPTKCDDNKVNSTVNDCKANQLLKRSGFWE